MRSSRTAKRSWFAVARRNKVAVGVAVWALLIGVFALFTPSVTVREQTSVVEALPQLDSAMGDAAGLLSGKPYGYALSPLTSEGECDITPVRAGEEYSRTITVYTGKKKTGQVLDDLFKGLRGRYDLEVIPFTATPAFDGTSDEYVDFELSSKAGMVTWRASTGCRPTADAVGQLTDTFAPDTQSVSVLSRLGVEAPRWSSASVTCGDLAGPGGTASTTVATGKLPEDAKSDLNVLAEDAPKGAEPTVSSKKLVSYRLGDKTHTTELDGRTVTTTATSPCSG